MHCCPQAAEAYEGAVKADAGHHAAALALAKLHLDRGEEEAGRGVCTRLLAAQPDNVQAQLLMVQLLTTQVSFYTRPGQTYQPFPPLSVHPPLRCISPYVKGTLGSNVGISCIMPNDVVFSLLALVTCCTDTVMKSQSRHACL